MEVMTVKRKIESTVLELTRQYKTNDPFIIADHMGIIVLAEDLGSVMGYYNTAFRQRMIHINENLPSGLRNYTAAHELGHAILHENLNTAFLRKNTYFSLDKLERQANLFAANLLISDYDLLENSDLTTEQFSQLSGYPIELIHLRLEYYGFHVI